MRSKECSHCGYLSMVHRRRSEARMCPLPSSAATAGWSGMVEPDVCEIMVEGSPAGHVSRKVSSADV